MSVEEEVVRLRRIVDAAEDLLAYRGNRREDEMWDALREALSS